MCLLSIPFGIVFGFLGVWTTVKIMNIKITNLLGTGQLIIRFNLSVNFISLDFRNDNNIYGNIWTSKKSWKSFTYKFY